MRPAEGGGSAPAPSGRDLKRGAEALTTFKKRVDSVLKDLAGSPAARVGDQQISRSSFSAGNAPFAEADGLFTQYNRVHTELTTLSQTLSDQIEAMQIAVHGADVGFNNLEEDVRRRFWAIQARTQQRAEDARKNAEGADAGRDKGHTGDDKSNY